MTTLLTGGLPQPMYANAIRFKLYSRQCKRTLYVSRTRQLRTE